MLTQEDREYAADLGFGICEECQTIFMPVPGYVNEGHQCNSDTGLEDRYWIGGEHLNTYTA